MVIDASVWISRHIPQDVNHRIAASWLNQHLSSSPILAIPITALVEVSGAIARRTGDSSEGQGAAQMVAVTPRLQTIPIDEQVARDAAQIAASQRLRGADALYVAVAARLNAPLVTFDRELATRAAAVVEVIRPA